jgi:Protein of unknown function with HXXEE motif
MNIATIPSWAWLFPVTYALHIFEEAHAGEGFGRWIRHVVGRQLGLGQFYLANGILWLAMVAAVSFFRTGPPAIWLLAALGAIVTVNGIGHLIGTLVIRLYSPGLVTGLILWLPLGLFALRWARSNGSIRLWYSGVISGIVLTGCVGLLGLALSKPVTLNGQSNQGSGSD